MKCLGSLNINPCPVCGGEDFSFWYELHTSQGLPLRLYCNHCSTSSFITTLPHDAETRDEAELLVVQSWNRGSYMIDPVFIKTQKQFKESIKEQIRKLEQEGYKKL